MAEFQHSAYVTLNIM